MSAPRIWRAPVRRAARHRASVVLGLLLGIAGIAPAHADDTEVFVNQSGSGGIRPNVLLIIDTSGSMNSEVALDRAPYDPNARYDGSCADNRIYWGVGSDPPPNCDDDPATFIRVSANTCNAATAALAREGLWPGKAAQWNDGLQSWQPLRPDEDQADVECESDAGVHGRNSSSSAKYARNGDSSNRWTTDAGQQIGWNAATVYTFYSANWLNWNQQPPTSTSLTRIEIVKSVAASLANSIDGINLGLMRYSNDPDFGGGDSAEGGMVTHELANVSVARQDIVDRINSYSAAGFTPLSETMYEAGQYFAGRNVDYGLNSKIDADTPFPSVSQSRRTGNQSLYDSPIKFQCQRNYAILLTDGEPTQDNSADSKIVSLPGFTSLVGSDCRGSGPGRCLADMTEYMFKADLSSLPGKQNAITYTIGFGPDVAGSGNLQAAAEAGGGRAYSAGDVRELTQTLQNIVTEILQTNASFATPAVSLNAFNRTQSNNELFVSLFKPSDALRWPGNLKKYAVRSGQLVDSAGRNAVDPGTGFFLNGTQSFWSAAPDDDRVDAGGAASRLPEPVSRRMFTFIAATNDRALSAAVNRFDVSNAALTDAVLRITSSAPTRDDVIRWARGVDVQDADADGDTSEPRQSMGDPLHAKPAVITYGGTAGSPDAADTVVYVPTNDGFIHAINAKTGAELWSFIPPELLGRVVDLYRNPGVISRTYGLDGDVRVLKFDVNQDGIVDSSAGDRVLLFFGMRRGGNFYYALDVTDRNNPTLKWKLGPNDLPGIGETWAMPTVARVNVAGATQNGEKLVLILGGGYDGVEEGYFATNDSVGNRIYMVDAVSGALLWFAGGPGSTGTPDLALPNMTHSIPARVVAIDTDGDQFADRLYSADMGGRVWRFDIFNGRPRSQLVTGGPLATLGAGDTGQTDIANVRRFYNAPDVALIQRRGAEPFYNIAIGSGYRGHPLHTETHDRLYSIRDRLPFTKLSQADYNAQTRIRDQDLFNITDNIANSLVPANSRGWKLELRLNGGWSGEKVLAEALTVDATVLFTTYQPLAGGNIDPCVPANGKNRVYALRVETGRPAIDYNDDQIIDDTDASQQLVQSGIAGEVNLVMESTRGQDRVDPNARIDALGRRSLCLVGVEVLKKCIVPGGVVRTFWQRTADDGTQ